MAATAQAARRPADDRILPDVRLGHEAGHAATRRPRSSTTCAPADRSVLELLDADYTFVNEQLAKHYGIAGVTGDKPSKVSLKPEHHRGGVLGMGAVLALTSHTFRTSPTQRGKYVLEVIFGTPPPPPPANAGMLKEDAPKRARSSR